MHTIQFDANTEQELTRLAALAGKDADQFIKDVVRDFLEEQEDIEAANASYDRYLAEQEKTVSLEELADDDFKGRVL